MDKSNDFIYISPLDAVLYAALFFLSFVIPAAVDLSDDVSSFYVTLFVNSTIIVREYCLLWRNATTSKEYWWKRLAGTFVSFSAAAYSIAMMIVTSGKPNLSGKTWVVVLNIIAMIFMCVPVFIALIELVKYGANNYKMQFGYTDECPTVVNENTKRV